MLILVADDDPTSLLIAVTTLRNLGHQCVTATDGTQAWASFQTRRPDVVLCDWVMPGMTGLELCRKIRAHAARYTYVIMVTAHDAHEDICEAMNAGADDYLVKPLDAAQVEIRLIVAARVTSLHRQLANQRTRLATVARREAVLRRA
ncbi:MAG: response regulator [Acidimicrobiales bacterium]|jgi:two-component system chemotaxis response regulator CheY